MMRKPFSEGVTKGGGWGADARFLDVVEAGYVIGRSDQDWMRGIIERIHPVLDEGLGVQVGTYLTDRALQIRSIVQLGERTAHADSLITKLLVCTDHRAAADLYRAKPVCTMSQCGVHALAGDPLWQQLVAETGVHDVLKVAIRDPSGRGLSIAANLGRARVVSRAEGDRLTRVGAHLGAAFRARSTDVHAPVDDAVLRPDGRVEHAEREATHETARVALRDAARAIDHARGRRRADDPDGALETWPALVDGRWTLLERSESDGRRFFVARRNEPRAPARADLTPTEAVCAGYAAMGHGQKLIAYELGVSERTVAMYVRRAMRKLALRSRAELTSAISGSSQGSAQGA